MNTEKLIADLKHEATFMNEQGKQAVSRCIEIIRKHSEPKPTAILRHALIEAIGNREGWTGDVSGLVDDLMIIIEGV